MFLISDAMAQTADAAAGGAGGLLMQIVPIVLIFVVFWFFLIRPQQKRQKEHMKMCSELAKGDEILTLGGIAGRIADLNDQYIVIEISRVDDKPVTITMQRGVCLFPSVSVENIFKLPADCFCLISYEPLRSLEIHPDCRCAHCGGALYAPEFLRRIACRAGEFG
mgnify:CR=1 FL=1